MKKYQFQNLQSSNIGYEHVRIPDGLFFAWTGTKFDNQTQVINKKAVIFVVIGTRPEAIKLAPVVHALRRSERNGLSVRVCATGQHKELLYETLDLVNVQPDKSLNVMKENQSLASLHSSLLVGISAALDELKEKTSNVALAIVQGDTMSALAGAEAAFYHRIPVAHVEAGLRSHLKYSPFPEELNRKQISSLATLHFAVSKLSEDNLRRENIHENIEVVGNTVIDQIQASLAYEIDNQTRRNLEELFPNSLEESSTGEKSE